MLTQLGGTALRSLSTRRLSARGNYWLNGGARVLGLLLIPRPRQEVHEEGPHEGLTKGVRQESCRLNYSYNELEVSGFQWEMNCLIIMNSTSRILIMLQFLSLIRCPTTISYLIYEATYLAQQQAGEHRRYRSTGGGFQSHCYMYHPHMASKVHHAKSSCFYV